MSFPLFGKCLKWVFQVCCRRFLVGRDSLKVKKIIKVKFFWVIAATTGHFYEWVSVFLEKCPRDAFCGTLSMVVAHKWFHNGFLCLYLSKRWRSVSLYNLHKERNGYQSQIPECRYKSKTCVEHIEQVIDKSLINSTDSFMNLLYFLHMRVICCKCCKKYVRKSNQETFNFFGRIYGHVEFDFSILVIGFKYVQRIS